MSGWYQKIARDIGQIPNAVAYYEQELDQAKYEVKIKGNLDDFKSDKKAKKIYFKISNLR